MSHYIYQIEYKDTINQTFLSIKLRLRVPVSKYHYWLNGIMHISLDNLKESPHIFIAKDDSITELTIMN